MPKILAYNYAIFNDQSFKDRITNDIISLEQLGPVCVVFKQKYIEYRYIYKKKNDHIWRFST